MGRRRRRRSPISSTNSTSNFCGLREIAWNSPSPRTEHWRGSGRIVITLNANLHACPVSRRRGVRMDDVGKADAASAGKALWLSSAARDDEWRASVL